ncbi:futalosine hydrolase [Mucilaginibacter arboris]|uniref:Futalosine hydrolase n=1 Tax=Mucilaginibacter arboris TaxID=2682090 RepID=A0A7K1SVM0_9SPHI|nr:futalosine hydrolase [Mucilaginibacter arboris]MVN21333.1 futalosine hydrolase [Mucilaginibacter arboris]
MNILLVAATQPEIQPLLDHFKKEKPFDVLITGVGMVATAFALGERFAQKKYNLAIHLGIAGSFDRDLNLGEVVEVEDDTLAELGAEDDDRFLSIDAMGFGESKFYPINSMLLLSIKKVRGITVNTVHGEETSIQKITERLNPQLESMEGAAFFYACKRSMVPSIQIRSVSNYVEKRNRENWKIGLAVKNLNDFAIELIKKL